MGLRKYQIDAIVNRINKKLSEKRKSVRLQLRASFKPTHKQQECLDTMDELLEVAEKMQKLREKADKLIETINEITDSEVGITYHYYRDFYPSTIEDNKQNFINNIINKKLKNIPDYQDIADSVTIATLSTGLDIEAWINNFVEKINVCEE